MRVVLGLAAGVLLAQASPLLAQASGSLETGTLRGSKPAGGFEVGKNDARGVARKFAACSVSRSPGLSERWLAAPIGGAASQRLVNQVLSDDCLGGGELQLPFNVIRGALFEQLYLRDFGRRPATGLAQVPPIDYLAGYPTSVPSTAINAIGLARFGDCVARGDDAAARGLLVTIPNTDSESKAIAALSPYLGRCLPKGEAIHFSKSVLRGAIAEGLYRLSRAAAGRPWVPTA